VGLVLLPLPLRPCSLAHGVSRGCQGAMRPQRVLLPPTAAASKKPPHRRSHPVATPPVLSARRPAAPELTTAASCVVAGGPHGSAGVQGASREAQPFFLRLGAAWNEGAGLQLQVLPAHMGGPMCQGWPCAHLCSCNGSHCHQGNENELGGHGGCVWGVIGR
jgi:hypothetical protein